MFNRKTVKLIFKEGLPLRDEKYPKFPWFDVVKFNGETYRVANPANVEEMKKVARTIEGINVNILIYYYKDGKIVPSSH